MNTVLVKKSRSYATQLLNQLPEVFTYHNLGHTCTVVAGVERIGRECKLSENDMETVLIAAWFHDVGYKSGTINHEQRSADEASRLLKEWEAPDEKITAVCSAIKATQMPQAPNNLCDQVLCDADLVYLADPDLMDQVEGLRKEFVNLRNMKFDSQPAWFQFNIQFLKNHKYFTPFGKTVLQEGKEKNIERLMELV